MPFFPTVIVEWTDAYGENTEQWYEGGQVDHEPLIVRTVGYLMRDDEIGITLWTDMTKPDGSSYRGRTFIPRGMVKAVLYLEPKRVRKPRKQKPSTE
jgi:hypothetical protein